MVQGEARTNLNVGVSWVAGAPLAATPLLLAMWEELGISKDG